MLYQKLLMGSKPYCISFATMKTFEMHRHPEIEFLYCLEGSCDIAINRRAFRLAAGDLIFVGSMLPHEVLHSENYRMLLLEVGPVLLGEYFEPLAKMSPAEPLLSRESCPELHALFQENAELLQSALPFSELHVRGNIYKICACALQRLMESASSIVTKRLASVSSIEKALELIENQFDQPLGIDYAASVCGYGKSNFCRIFKQITGDTFHNFLNHRRVRSAQLLLKETNASVESIAQQSGFPDAKSLCRVFRRLTNQTPGAFRKSHHAMPNEKSLNASWDTTICASPGSAI